MTGLPRLLIQSAAVVLVTAAVASAQQPSEGATRYLALGDSTASGFKAQPATRGYTFLLYENGVFDRLPRTLFTNLGTVGATSQDVLLYQVPLALIPASRGGFVPSHVTLTVGGNDLAAIRAFALTNPGDAALALFIQNTLTQYGANLTAILQALTTGVPGVKIFVGNQYSVPEIEALLPGADQVLAAFNQTTATVAALFPGVFVVDVYGAFLDREGLLLIDRRSASQFEVHLTNAGHRAMAQAFAEVIDDNK